MKQVYIIGGGAAGFFCAINLAKKNPSYKITILEKTTKLLSKVLVSGGGRCNVTNQCFEISDLIKNYPRGSKELRSVFSKFAPQDTIEWFAKRNVKLHAEADNRMFPTTNNSQTIIDCFIDESKKHGVTIQTKAEVKETKKQNDKIVLSVIVNDTNEQDLIADAVVITSGGFNQEKAYGFLQATGHTIVKPLPSLFTFNIPNDAVTQLMGLSVPNAKVKVAGTNYLFEGPLLITHWGFSGPAVLKLSAYAAEYFHQKSYEATIHINWLNKEYEEIKQAVEQLQKQQHKALPKNTNVFVLPKRLWEHLLIKADLNNDKPWSEITKKSINKLVEVLFADSYTMRGKTTFKEEFVTCGGIELKEIDFKTMQSKKMSELYFAGEVINIDGITGGFNFQAAWSTAWVAANSI